MECWLCHALLVSTDCQREMSDKETLQLIATRLNNGQQLLDEDIHQMERRKACSECFTSYQELCGLTTELSKIEDAIQKRIELLKLRLTQPKKGHAEKSATVTKSHTTKQNLVMSPIEVKEEEDWTQQSTELCDMEVSDTEENTDDEFLDESEEFYVKDESDSEAESTDSVALDETAKFILDQLLSESESSNDSKGGEGPESDAESMVLDESTPGKLTNSLEVVLGQLLSDSESETLKESEETRLTRLHGVRRLSKDFSSTINRNRKATFAFECELCSPKTKFPSKTFLSHHYELDHRDTERIFLCEKFGCDETFLTYELLQIHSKSHRQFEGRPVTETPMLQRSHCRFCLQSSNYPHELRNHELEKHSDELKHSCQTCEAKFSTSKLLKAHKSTHSENVNRFKCLWCSKKWTIQFEDALSLDSHLIRIHNFFRASLKSNRNSKEMLNTQPVLLKGEDKSLVCEDCDRVFPNLSLLRKHKCQRPLVSCELCNQTFGRYGEPKLIIHTAKMHEGNESQMNPNLNCTKCPKLFATTLMYKRHVNCHNLETKFPFHCSPCELRFPEERLLSDHNNVQHSMKPSRNSKPICEGCDKKFPSVFDLRKHERKDHPHIFTNNCTKCEATFSKPELLETHLKTHQTPETPFTCSLCPSRSYLTASGLDAHLKAIHTIGFAKNCSVCEAAFASKDEVTIHMHLQHGHPYPKECSLCSKRFPRSADLNRHMKRDHATEDEKRMRRVQCKVCQKWFTGAKSFGNHMKAVHEKSNARVCEICGKTIKGTSAMKNHMKSHREEKNFACEFCGKRFVRSYSLQVHRYTHTGEKPLGCYICDKRFNQHSPLKKHIETHKKDGSWFPKPSDPPVPKESNSSKEQDKLVVCTRSLRPRLSTATAIV